MNLRITTDEELKDVLGIAEDAHVADSGAITNGYVRFDHETLMLTVDGHYRLAELEALVYWMRTYGKE